MGDKAGITRSLNNIKTELEYLRDSGVVQPPQFDSIMAQLPQNGVPSQYFDPRFAQGANHVDPSAISQASQDPSHPANPNHPKVSSSRCLVLNIKLIVIMKHGEWARKLGAKFGNAAVFGAGATAGSDLVNSVLH
ncbi:MAG: hypothetical protein Q9218_000431 [Villophora microphyllina]